MLSRSQRLGCPCGTGTQFGGLSGFDVGEDVGFADAGAGYCGVPPVGPDRVDVGAADRDAAVVADEGSAAEEPEVGVPGPGADPAAGPAGPAVGRPGLPGVDVDVGRVEPPVEPDRVQVAGAGPGDPREPRRRRSRTGSRPGGG